MDCCRVDFGLLRGLVDKVPWEAVMKDKGVYESWTFFQKEILNVHEQDIAVYEEMNQWRRPA